ncbi:hypothetical protein BaRGS_00010432 [Batillaria attramentaria]|uniref:Uncharacterized protein n=1 Tax=Batillaria attramentaria TaxID=370345 RepID=A0ABD0LFR5_9CAEN
MWLVPSLTADMGSLAGSQTASASIKFNTIGNSQRKLGNATTGRQHARTRPFRACYRDSDTLMSGSTSLCQEPKRPTPIFFLSLRAEHVAKCKLEIATGSGTRTRLLRACC